MRRTCLYRSFSLIFILLALVRCANIVSPEGGAKDISPPAVVSCEPPNNSTSFKGKSVKIDFDEFINAETSGDKVLISPPVDKTPDFRLRGKSLIIGFEDPLAPDLTYTIDLGTSVSDITEGNKLQGFIYAFSTGTVLDSLTLTGSVRDAFTNQPAKGVLVMLYLPKNDTIPADSLPVRIKPAHVTRTGDDGGFIFTHLAPASYKIIALGDKTGDMLFNTVGEQVAFSDSLVQPWYAGPTTAEIQPADSTVTDSVSRDTFAAPPAGHPVALRIFEAMDSVQTLIRSALVRDRMATLIFRYPPGDLRLVPVNIDSLSPWCLAEPGVLGDTLTLWMQPGTPDTLRIRITADKMKPDTIELPVRYIDASKKGKKAVAEGPKRLEITNNTRGSLLNFFKYPLILTTSYPIDSMDLSGLRLIDGNDTLKPFTAMADSSRRRIVVEHRWTEGKAFRLYLPDSAIFSINGLTNDTLRFRFKTAETRFYGNLKLNVKVPEGADRVIVQLLAADKEKVLEERVINKTGRISFDYLLPAKYKIKAILDRNYNGRWDTGDYFRHLQPEEVVYFPRTLDLRANWDVEENWQL